MPLDLPPLDRRGRADFLRSPANAAALAAVERDGDWPGGRMLILGPEGSGKSHLARIWAEGAGAALVAGTALEDEGALHLAARGAVAIDGAEGAAGRAEGERALYHLWNLAGAGGLRLLLTARRPPRDWGLRLADAQSRMEAMPLTRIEAPDDALLSGVLVKLFAERQLAVAPALIPYLVTRMERSLAAAAALVAALDARALAERRPVTRALAAEVLDTAAPR
jgi:chromosomal replication initiation ATPase DnaA